MASGLVFGSPTGPAQYGDDEDKENTPRPPVTLSMEDVEEADDFALQPPSRHTRPVQQVQQQHTEDISD